MKYRFVPILMILGFFAAIQAQAIPIHVPPTQIVIEPTDLFLPTGFDDNDMAQAIVAGDLGDICVKVGKLHAQVDEKNFRILLRQEALRYLECWCTKLSVPYHQVVDLGVLKAGEYEVQVEGAAGSLGLRGALKVAAASTSAPDDHLYAPIEDAQVEMQVPPVLVLRGTFPNGCMKLREIRVNQVAKNVVEVLPIVDLSDGCEADEIAFESRTALPKEAGKTLVHIRALNGRSINKIVSQP